MKQFLRSASLSLAFATLIGNVSAQSPVDIGLFQNDGMLEVRVRPTADFSGIFSSLVYTIRWDANSGASLGDPVQEEGAARSVAVTKSGSVRNAGTFNYMVYAGFGMTPMSSHGLAWEAGNEYVIATIPVIGKGEFELVNDSYTSEVTNNANFYAALGGSDNTGIIYHGLASTEEDGSVIIQPNPNNGMFSVSFQNNDKSDVTVEIVNSLGQSVYNETVRQLEGAYKKDMDLSSMSAGVYHVKLQRNGTTTTHKVVFR